jgi:hypothetical protein
MAPEGRSLPPSNTAPSPDSRKIETTATTVGKLEENIRISTSVCGSIICCSSARDADQPWFPPSFLDGMFIEMLLPFPSRDATILYTTLCQNHMVLNRL